MIQLPGVSESSSESEYRQIETSFANVVQSRGASFLATGYASSAAKHAVNVTNMAQIVGVSGGPAASNGGSETHNPTFDQYRPGKGCGDKNPSARGRMQEASEVSFG